MSKRFRGSPGDLSRCSGHTCTRLIWSALFDGGRVVFVVVVVATVVFVTVVFAVVVFVIAIGC